MIRGLLKNATQCFTDREAPIGFVPILALARSWRAHYYMKIALFAVSLSLLLQPIERSSMSFHTFPSELFYTLLFFPLSLTIHFCVCVCATGRSFFFSSDRRGQRNKKETDCGFLGIECLLFPRIWARHIVRLLNTHKAGHL
jgi:hypothetical protein